MTGSLSPEANASAAAAKPAGVGAPKVADDAHETVADKGNLKIPETEDANASTAGDAGPAGGGRAAPPKPRRRIVPYLVALIALGVVGGGLWLASLPVPDLIQGMVDANEINVSSKTLGRVERFLAYEGDMVSPGQLLVVLSSPETDASKRQADADLATALARQQLADIGDRSEDIAAVRSNLLAAEAKAKAALATNLRIEILARDGFAPRQRRDETRASRDSAANEAEYSRQQYGKALAGNRVEDRDAAAAQVRIAQAGVDRAEAQLAELRLVAPVAGEISRRLVEAGEVVQAAAPIFQLSELGAPWVSANVRESQFAGLRMGQVLQGSVPALNDEKQRFRVYFINPQGDFATWRATRQSAGYDVRSFEVRLRPKQPIEGLRPGMSVLFDWPQ